MTNNPYLDEVEESNPYLFDLGQVKPSAYELAKMGPQEVGPVMNRDVPAAVEYGVNAPIAGINTLLNTLNYGGQAMQAIHSGEQFAEPAPPTSGEERALMERQALEPFGFNQIRPPENLLTVPTLGSRIRMTGQNLPIIGPAFRETQLPYQVEEMRQGPEVPNDVLSAVRLGARNVAAPMLTPEGIGMLVAAGVAPEIIGIKYGPKAADIARRLVAGYFGYEGSKGFVEAAPNVIGAPTLPQGIQTATEALGSGAIGFAGLKHALLPRAKAALSTSQIERTKNASSIQEATAVHGDVRTQQEPTSKLPVEEGGAGVLPEAKGRVQKGEQVELLLNQEEASYLQAERQGIKGEGGIEVVTEPASANAPFSSGEVATIDRKTGKVIVFAPEYKKWLAGVAPENRAKAVSAMISEELIHLATREADALSYWNNLTGVEKAMETRLYTGEWSLQKAQQKFNREFSETDLGYEAARRRMQRLARITSMEVAELVGREKWTVKSIEALQQMVSSLMEKLPTEGAAVRKSILGRIQENLDVAKVAASAFESGAVPSGEPSALRRKIQIEDETGNIVDATFDGYWNFGKGPMPAVSWQLKDGKWTSGLLGNKKIVGEIPTPEQWAAERQAPSALRRNIDPNQQEMLLPPVEKSQVVERGVDLPKEAGGLPIESVRKGQEIDRGGFPVPKGSDITGLADTFVKEAGAASEIPSFDSMVGVVQGRYGAAVPRASLYYTWIDSLNKWLTTASGKEVEGMMDKLRLRRDVAISTRPGMTDPRIWKGAIPDRKELTPTEWQFGMDPRKFRIKKANEARTWAQQFGPGQRRRSAAIGAIIDKLSKESGAAPEKPWKRTEIGPEDIAQDYVVTDAARVQKGMTEEVEGDFSQPEVATKSKFVIIPEGTKIDPKAFGSLITKGAASDATGKGAPPRTVSKNLVALQDKAGRVILVSTWKDPRFGPKVTNPDVPSGPGLRVSDALLEQYKPVAYMGIREPVQGFRKVFPDREAFNKYFGDVGIEGSEGLRGGSFVGPNVDIAKASSGLLKGSVPPPEAEANVRALLDKPFESPTAQELTTPQRKPIRGGEVIPQMPRVQSEPASKFPAVEAYELEKRAAEAHEVSPTYTWQSPSYAGPTGRIVEYGKPEKMGVGWPLRAGLEGTVMGRRTPAAMNRHVVAAANVSAKLLDKTMIEGLRLYSEWMVERLERVGGPKAKAFADAANTMITREREIYGAMTPALDKARKLAGKFGRATMWMHGLRKVTNTAATSRMVGALEGTINVPAFSRELTDAADAANYLIGQQYQRANKKFQAGHKVQRNPTGFGYDLIREGDGPAWQKWVNGMAVANNMPLVDTIAFFKRWKRVLDDPGVNEAAIDRVNQDFKRVYPKVITHIKHAWQWQAVIHADVFNYLESAARMASHSSAFREFFPQTKAARRALQKLMDDIRAETGGTYHDDLTALMRALQGHPTDTYSNLKLVRPGQPIGEMFRFLNTTVGNLFAKLVLTKQMITQSGEVLSGSAPVFLGYDNYVRGLARLADPRTGSQLYRQMELQGMVNRVILDFSFDWKSPVRSTFKIGGNVISKVFAEQFFNELQEAAAAATAKVVSERIQNKNLSQWERSMLPRTFKAMGFNPPQVVEIMRGNPDLLAQFESKAASFLTSGNKAIAEGGTIGANRLFNSVFRFQSYPMMKTNQLRQVWGGAIDAWKNGTTAEKVSSTRMLARYLFGNTAQGAITVGMAALMARGLFGAKVTAQEAKDDPLSFMVDTFAATMGGPLYLVWNGAQDKGIEGYGESASRMLFPWQMMKEMWAFGAGSGYYKDMDLWDKIGKFSRLKIPGLAPIQHGMAVVGLSTDNPDLDTAMASFYRWRRKELGPGGTPPLLKNDVRAGFRVQMKKAVAALQDGNTEKYEKALEQAWELAADKNSVKSSLRSRTILKGPGGDKLDDDELYLLRQRIGDRAVDLLEDYDAMIEAAAQ